MHTATPQRLETVHGDVEYLDVGEGLPTLYFHGTGAGNDAALLLEHALIRSGCRLIVPNRPGYYGTTLGPAGSANFCAALAAELLKHLSIDRAAVIGTSGGGMPAAAFARCYPNQVAGLILQCAESHAWTSGKWLPNGLAPALFLFRHRVFTPLLLWQNMRSAKSSRRDPVSCIRQMAGKRFDDLKNVPEVVQQITALTEMTLRCADLPAGIRNDWAMLVGDNGIATGGGSTDSIDCPTLIIHDPADPLVPFQHAQWSCSCIRRSRLLSVQAGGHLIWFGKDADWMHHQRVAFIQQVLAG